MSEPIRIDGQFDGRGRRIAIVAARFNSLIVESLVSGAVDTLVRHGVEGSDITVVRVPGAFELPFVVRRVIRASHPDAVITLGAVIRGSTPHFDYVAGECASGVSRVAAETDVPVIFGVLTTDTIEQAVERAGTKAGNKGSDAALTALEMVSVLERIPVSER